MAMQYKAVETYSTPVQNTDKKYNKWKDLVKVKVDVPGGAICAVKSKEDSACTPSVLTLDDFFKPGRVSIPEDCDPKKITVEFNHTLSGSAKIAKPKVELYYNGVKKGTAYAQAPGKNATASATFNTSLKASEINDPDRLKIKIIYPGNTTTGTGNLYLYWVRLKCEYQAPSYSLKITNNNTEIRKDSEFSLGFTITNTAGTSYSPKPTINLPTNLSYTGKSGDGSISQEGNVLTWTPGLTTSKTQASVNLKFKSLDALHKVVGYSCITRSTTNSISTEFDVLNHLLLLTLSEPDDYNIKDDETIPFTVTAECDENFINTDEVELYLDGAVNTIVFNEDEESTDLDHGEWGTFTLNDFPLSTKQQSTGFTFGLLDIEDDAYQVPFTATPETEYSLRIGSDWITTVNTDSNGEGLITWVPEVSYSEGDIGYIYETTTTEDNETFVMYKWTPDISEKLTTNLNLTITPQNVGNLRKEIVLKIGYHNETSTYTYYVIPANIQATYYDYIELSAEELARLGDGYSYELSSYLRVEEPDADSNINLVEFSEEGYQNVSNLELDMAMQSGNDYSLTLQCTNEELYGGNFTVYDNEGNILDTATADNSGFLSFDWTFENATIDDYAYITYDSYYEAGIPDYGFNHRIGIFNDDPARIINDPTGHSTSWTNTDLTVGTYESHTLLTGTGTYINDYEFEADDTWNLQFNYLPMEEEEDLTLKSVLIGSKEISFNNLGISAEEPTKVNLEYTEGLLNCYIDDEFFCIYEDFEPTSNYSFGFKNTGSELAFYDFEIFELDEVKIQLNIINTAFQNTNWSTQVKEHNKWTECTVEFPYNSGNPLFIFFSGEPLELESTNKVKLKYTQPCLQEEDENNHYRECGNYPTPFKNIINQEDALATVEGSSEQVVIYDFSNFITLNNLENVAIQGIELQFNAPHQENSSILCTLRADGAIGNRSVILDEENEDDLITVGGEFDKWGLDFGDFKNLENIELIIQHNADSTISINQPKVTIYYEDVEENVINCYISDDDDNAVLEDTRFYGMFLTSVEINGGVDTNTEYLQVSGTDTNECYRMSLDKKEIKLNFNIRGCDFTESSTKLKRIAKLFMNERDDLNRPIPRRIMFSHYPDEYWLYVMESSIQANPNISEYDCSLTLAVPSGTSYTKEILSTNATGSNDSLVKVSPTIKLSKLSQVISLINGSDNWEIDFRERTHLEEQTVSEKDYLEIDCSTRKVYLHKYIGESEPYDIIDVTEYCSYGNDWFLLQGEYNFQCDGATIGSISFRERW